jgi:D-alanyl-D-alanine dipeptidase
MALHTAFKEAGFSELASEWWHFADEETEAEMRSIVGDNGMDYVAQLS